MKKKTRRVKRPDPVAEKLAQHDRHMADMWTRLSSLFTAINSLEERYRKHGHNVAGQLSISCSSPVGPEGR